MNLNFNKKVEFIYVLVNVAVAGLSFVRTFSFMDFLTEEGLGTVSLIITVSGILGFTQIGLINGGYRIIAECDNETKEIVNNTVFSYILIVSSFLVILLGIALTFNWVDNILLILGTVILGISLMLSNWLSNVIIGSSDFIFASIANLLSATGSIILIIPVSELGLIGALIVLIAQPLIFIIYSLTRTSRYRPTRFSLKLGKMKYILRFGFIPFISSLLFLLFMHVEKIGINFALGTEALGKLYLLFGFITLVSLIPTSLTNLFFPISVKHFSNSNKLLLRNVLRRYFLLLFAYIVLVCIFVYNFLEMVVSYFFINHVPNVEFVLIAVPGIVAKTLCEPITMKLNAMVKLKHIFFAESLSFLFYMVMLLYAVNISSIELSHFVWFSNVYFFIKLGLYVISQSRIFDGKNFVLNK